MSTTHLLAADKQKTPLSGTGISSRCHTPYGALPCHDGPVVAYCGEPRDSGMDRYHLGNGHRVYNPVLMRFQSSDGLSPFGKGGINAYGYCAGDPVNYSDPRGRSRNGTGTAPRTWLLGLTVPDKDAFAKGAMVAASANTAIGAVARTFVEAVNRETTPVGQYVEKSKEWRTANTLLLYSGGTGIVLHLLESGPTNFTPVEFGMTAAGASGAFMLYRPALVDAVKKVGTDYTLWPKVLARTAYEVSGAGLAVEWLSGIGQNFREGYQVIPGDDLQEIG